MSEWEQILYTAFATLIGGTILYVVGELLSKRYIDPIDELRRQISQVRYVLSFFAPVIHTPISRNDERSTEAARALREVSANLLSMLELLPNGGPFRRLALRALPPEEDIEDAAIHLRALSTHMHEMGDEADESIQQVNARVRKIQSLLGFRDEDEN
ncbi:MAG: hypothetical protein HND55_00730 [Pseudomonadota bacterium]|nr:MAG: hypothetical protein HND55_00730 [Pseudomonadota bacterium]